MLNVKQVAGVWVSAMSEACVSIKNRLCSPRSVRLVDVQSWLSCTLCGGYLIDATTISRCLHTCELWYNSNDHWKHLCLGSWAMAPCVWTLRALTGNFTYLLTWHLAVILVNWALGSQHARDITKHPFSLTNW